MKLATLRNQTRDGQLVVVSTDNQRYVVAGKDWPTLQSALDNWNSAQPKLAQLYQDLNKNTSLGQAVVTSKLHAPLPRAYEWIDGSAFLNHVRLVRKARGAEMPPSFLHDPLVYQGGSGVLIGPTDDIVIRDEAWGCDFEAEVCVILADTPMGVKAEDAHKYIRLVLIANDVSLRNLVPVELEKGFGFFQSKPATAFSPLALTPDELGDAWRDGRLHLPLVTRYNNKVFGDPNAGAEMHFSFHDLIAHITKTRAYTAGTILGSGTISNEDRARGSSCLAEKRMIEKIDTGTITTPFMKHDDTVVIEMFDKTGKSLFGQITQKVTKI